MLKTYFQKLSEKAISPHQATPGSVGYDLFTPIDFIIQPQEQVIVISVQKNFYKEYDHYPQI